jgi:hypothetical protein
MLTANLVRSVASGERYLDACACSMRRAGPDAALRAHGPARCYPAQTRSGASLRQPPALCGGTGGQAPGLTPEERLWLNTVASMPYELALMVRFDPVVRSVGGAVAVVGAVEAAPVAYVASEDAAVAGLEASAEF